MNERVTKIHEASMRILEQTGMKFLHPDAVKILNEHGIRMEGNVAYFTEAQIMHWVGKAPSTAKVYAADSRHDIEIGGRNVYCAPSAGPTQIMDRNGAVRQATIQDYIDMLKLYEVNDSYKVGGGVVCQPDKIPEALSTLILYYLSLIHSEKAVWAGCGNYEQMEAVMKLAQVKFNLTEAELKERPHVMGIVNTNTPLQFDINMTETLLTFLKYRQPVVIAAAAMAGTTAPVTMAGMLAVVNAEVIAAVALAQMYAPGAPVIYGSQSTNADMSTCAIAVGSPEGALSYKYCAEMARFYGIPSRAGGSLTDAKSLNVQAGYESMLTYYACHDSGVNVIFQSAGILNSYLAASFEKMIVDFEIIDYVTRYKKEFEVDEETVPLQLIDEVGHGGQFLMEEHTFEYCRKEPLIPSISVRGPHADAQKRLDENIDKRLTGMLAAYQKPMINEQVRAGMQKVLLDSGVEPGLLKQLDEY